MKKIFTLIVSLFAFLASSLTASANTFVTVLDDVSTGWVDTVPAILNTPLWNVIYFLIGITVITTALWILLSIFTYFKNR